MVKLESLKTLSQVESIKDVKPLAKTVFPGAHCPLFGSALILKGVTDALMIVIGTDECTYYTKKFSLGYDSFGGMDGRCVSLVLDQHDVTFGCAKKLEAGIRQMYQERKPSAIFLVTTCVVEITGDDVDSIGDVLSDELGIPIVTVHTEHFRCESHMQGMERVLTACAELMEPCDEQVNGINILGHRFGELEKTEFIHVLQDHDIHIHMKLPSDECTVADVANASASKVNVVTNAIALPLAKKMQTRFGIPYIEFYNFCSPDAVYHAYKDLFDYLGKSFPEELEEKYQHALETVSEAKKTLDGKSFIYGNTTLPIFECIAFLVSLGMKPLLVQTKEIPEEQQCYIEQIKNAGYDPYITKSANITPLQPLYDILKPTFYIGHENPMNLMKKGITQLTLDKAAKKLGFELTEEVVSVFVNASSAPNQIPESMRAMMEMMKQGGVKRG